MEAKCWSKNLHFENFLIKHTLSVGAVCLAVVRRASRSPHTKTNTYHSHEQENKVLYAFSPVF